MRRTETAPAWNGWKSRASAKRRKSRMKKSGEVAEPVENTSRRVIIVRMIVDDKLDWVSDAFLDWIILVTK